jgi:hypothetical protein
MYFESIDTRDPEEARKVKHDFIVESQRISTEIGLPIPDKKAIVKIEDTSQPINNDLFDPMPNMTPSYSDTYTYLGTVGIGWEPVQPSVLYDMAGELLESTGGSINGILNMHEGAVIGISFKLAEREYVTNDKMDLNFLMLTAFNGMYGLSGNAIAYRYATDSMANTSNKVFNLKHTKFVANRIAVVKDMLKYYNQEINSFDVLMNRLVTKPMSNTVAIDWFRSLFPKPQTSRSEVLLENSVEKFVQILGRQYEENVPGVKGTSYGAWCALTEYVNHQRTVRVHNDRDEDEVRFQSINFGTGNRVIQKGISKLSEFHFDANEFMID